MESETLLAAVVGLAVICYALWIRVHRKPPPWNQHTAHVLVVLGSGGHTAEMLAMVSSLDETKYHATWVVADTDKTSLPRMQRDRATANHGLLKSSPQNVLVIPRSREVGQGWLSTIFTTARASLHAVKLVISQKPNLILLNGPGTCVPILLGALCLRVWYNGTCGAPKIIFIESFCRVQSLSLTGKICYPFADRFIVQWPNLANRYTRAEYLGVIF